MRSVSSLSSRCGFFLRLLVNRGKPADQSAWQSVVPLPTVVVRLVTPRVGPTTCGRVPQAQDASPSRVNM